METSMKHKQIRGNYYWYELTDFANRVSHGEARRLIMFPPTNKFRIAFVNILRPL
jgi:hypothetical protein